MKTSFPKQDIHVLLLEGVSASAMQIFRQAGYTQVEALPGALPEAELKARLAEAHIVGIRSRTQLTS
jgi:D-3-phosphoglycerate dehydrogenase / 2-oxoglutarate reductase